MLQFNDEEILNIRDHVTSSIINKLKQDNDIILTSDTLVPPDARSSWNLYYYCPHHGVRLIWDRYNPTQHACPIDGEVFTGEPYNSAWWRWLNDLNSKACYELGLLWQLTQEPIYLDKVKSILLEYAIRYPHYEVHGDIPYNGPGKINAQTLCEANCMINFARGYDFICQDIYEFEREKIETSLLREGAEFLIQNRTPQLHNHEIKINAAVGIIGLILNDSRYISFALISDYGLHYQLNHGCIGEGMWFEGSIHYHYYALQSLLAYEKIAYKTQHSLSNNPNLLKMLKFPLNLIMSNGNLPRLNDCIAGQEQVIHSEVFEFGFREYPFEILHKALQYIYSQEERNNLEALLYGVETLKQIKNLSCQSSHHPDCGYTTEYSSQSRHFMLVKHAPFGGEHDHYDRLNLILCRHGYEILPDLGTTGYGANLHYDYYKNSASHNTLVVNESNQPPNNPKVLNYEKTEHFSIIDTLADWTTRTENVDSHTIVQWNNDAYRSISYRRTIIWIHGCVIDISSVHNSEKNDIALHYLIRGKHNLNSNWQATSSPFKHALHRLTDCHKLDQIIERELSYKIPQQPNFHQQIHTNSPCQLVTGYGPDNPATSDIAYLTIHSKQTFFSSLVLHDLSGETATSNVKWQTNEAIYFTLRTVDGQNNYCFDFTTSTLQIL